MSTEIINPLTPTFSNIFKSVFSADDTGLLVGKLKKITTSDDPNPINLPQTDLTDAEKLKRYNDLDLGAKDDDGNFVIGDDWKANLQKLKDNQEKHTDDDLKPLDWNEKIEKLENYQDKLKGMLGLLPNVDLPADWDNLLTRKSDLDEWTNTFPSENPKDVKKRLDNQIGIVDPEQKQKLDDYNSLKEQVQRLETLLKNRSSRNNIDNSQKKEYKLCEICSQIKNDTFKYSRISSRGFNTYHVYRICSFCQKIVQLVVTSSNDEISTKIY